MQPVLVSQAPELLSPGSWCHTQALKLNLGNSLLEDWLFRVVGGGVGKFHIGLRDPISLVTIIFMLCLLNAGFHHRGSRARISLWPAL